jgi:hypothetical protein
VSSAWERQPQWVLTTETTTWLATPAGLYQYDSEAEIFQPEIFPDLPDFAPYEIVSDGEQLWAISDSAAAYIDLFSGGRYGYTVQDGIPPGKLTCATFAGDYVWIGSDRGVARFDRFIEQWEYFDLKQSDWPEGAQRVTRIEPVDDFLYFSTAEGIVRFDTNTESLQFFTAKDGLKAGAYGDIHRYGDELWFLGSVGIDIYSISQRNWSFLGIDQGFRSTEWQDIEAVGDNLYFIFSAGIDVCEVTNRQIYPFDREFKLEGYEVRDITGSIDEIWFATDRGLLQYEVENPQKGQAETWILFDRQRGASQTSFSQLAASLQFIFGRGEWGQEVLDVGTETFLQPLIYPEIKAVEAEAAKYPRLDWDKNGLQIQPSASYRLGITGKYSYLVLTDGDETNDRYWGRLQPFIIHESGRSAGGLYDNTDPDEELYGATYRGNPDDLLRRVEAGNRVKFLQTHDLFSGGTTLRGASAMLEAGPRKGKKKRSLLRGNLTFGERVTRSEREFFTGAQGPVFFLQHRDLLIGSAEVKINGRLLNTDEYTLSYTLGQLFFTFSGWELLNEGDIIEVSYQYRLDEEHLDETLTAAELVVSHGDALQITLSGFEKSDSDSLLPDMDDGFQATQLSAEARGDVLGGEGRLFTGLTSSKQNETDDVSNGFKIEGDFNRGAWTLNGAWSALTDSLPTLEDRTTEFGYFKGENEFGVRFEPSGMLRLEGHTGTTRGKTGSERNYHFSGQITPVSGTAVFSKFDHFDASTDDFDRERWIASLGFESSFSPELLDALKLRSSRLFILGKASEVRLDSTAHPDAAGTKLRTQSVLTRWNVIPGAKISLYPELRWSKSERATGGGVFQPESEEFAPRGMIYTRNLIPGMITHFDGEASYQQSGFDPVNNKRNVELQRQGIARIDISPGVYWAAFNPVSVRFNFARNAEDSLIDIGDEISLFDLGFDWKDYPGNVESYRFDSDAVQVTWAPGMAWLLYQSISEVRVTSAPVEQFFATRLEWKPTGADQVYWRYTLNRVLADEGDEYEHRPGVEWYRRWSRRTYTRTQLYVTVVDESDQKKIDLSPGGYLDQKITLPLHLGEAVLRTDLTATYSDQSLPENDRKFILSGYARIDWSVQKLLFLRLRVDGDYDYSYESGEEDLTWTFEGRVSARF